MSRSPVNIANIVLTNDQYYKLKVYANNHQISIHESIRLLIDSLPETSQPSKNLSTRYLLISSRKFLQSFFDVQN
jgi:hypothetical protein